MRSEVSRVMSRRCVPSPIRTSPSNIRVNPKIECRTVDFPAPLGPIRQSDCPLATCSVKPWRICMLP